VVGKAENSQ